MSFFEVIGKNERDSGGPVDLHKKKESHDSGFSDRAPAAFPGPDFVNAPKSHHPQSVFRMSALGKGSSPMVYGIVQYDFQAERPDELDARAGEAIIVIAQSNPEWFVAKPIGRLGGPGLIPVSFIELRDMQSGQAVTDPLEAVRRAGVPKVEEWKKMTAEYKNSSITLGKIDPTPPSSMQSVTSSMDKMSVGHQSVTSISQNGTNSYVSRLPPVPAAGPRSRLSTCFSVLTPRLSRATTSAILAKGRCPNSCPSRRRRRHRATHDRSWPQSLRRSPDIVSTTTSIGTSLKRRWRMAAAGNCRVTIMISTTSRSPSSPSSRTRRGTAAARERSRSCPVPSPMSPLRSPTAAGRTWMSTSRS